ncbi:sulfotransferase family protein [Kitasatospora sp. NPDC058965]|uniref:sulfotransferase family protein n=1 Tax=Kitasatospora sp. NPDC058965 TaxID=3346682 RepID=UPI00368089E8
MIGPGLPVRCVPPPPAVPGAGLRVLVFGSARSGTTLLLNLFRTFEDVHVRDGEHCLGDLLGATTPGWTVAKRTPHCADHFGADLADFPDTWIVDIVRDPRDVVTSVLPPWPGFYCDFARWDRDVRAVAALRGRHLRLVQLRYEDLVRQGDAVQGQLANLLGLTVRLPFSSFPQAVPADLSEQAVSALGGVRPLSDRQVGRWQRSPERRDRVREQLRSHPFMEPMLQCLGYPATVWEETNDDHR